MGGERRSPKKADFPVQRPRLVPDANVHCRPVKCVCVCVCCVRLSGREVGVRERWGEGGRVNTRVKRGLASPLFVPPARVRPRMGSTKLEREIG